MNLLAESFLDMFLAHIAGALLASVVLTVLFGGIVLLVRKGRKSKMPDWTIAVVFVLLCLVLVGSVYFLTYR